MTRRAAVVASITEDLLNDVVVLAVGEGVDLSPLEQRLTLPGMGEVDLGLALRITGTSYACSTPSTSYLPMATWR